MKSNTPTVERHPVLMRLLAAGAVRIINREYVGTAADGTEVSLGITSDPDGAESYLAAHPNPKDW